MYASLWTLLQQKKDSYNILPNAPFYYRIWYRMPEENTMHYIRFSDIDEVVEWIAENPNYSIWVVEESRMLLTDEEV